MKVQSMKFLLLIALILLPIHGGKRGPKVYPQKDESSDEYKRATAFFRPRARPNECDVNEVRSKTGEELLRDLMLMYTMTTEEMRNLKKEKLREMSEELAHKVWKRPGKKIDSYYNNDFIV